MSAVEGQLFHGGNKLNAMASSMQADLDAGSTHWEGRPELAKTPAFTAWFTSMKTQLSQFISHYDQTVQEMHERLGVFSTPTGVVGRLGLKGAPRHPVRPTLRRSVHHTDTRNRIGLIE